MTCEDFLDHWLMGWADRSAAEKDLSALLAATERNALERAAVAIKNAFEDDLDVSAIDVVRALIPGKGEG